jgi:hypothetical protein
MPNIKKVKRLGFVPDYGSNAFLAGLGFEHSGHRVCLCLQRTLRVLL